MEEWKSQSEPEPDFRDNSNLLGKSPRKKKKKSSKKGTKNESDVWSDNNNPERGGFEISPHPIDDGSRG